MNYCFKRVALAFASAALMLLHGCGGGDIAEPVAAVEAEAEVSFTGTAASGAAFVGAIVTVLDSRGQLVGTSDPTGADGVYKVKLKIGAVAPFIVTASRTNADGQTESLVSVAESSSVTTLNVTPVTNLIASRLSASGDPSRLAAELAAGTARISPASVAAVVAEIRAILAPMLAATGQSDTNPLTSAFTANGAGYDRLLDSLNINIIPASATSANIEIGVKTTGGADGAAPVVIQFRSGDSIAAITTTNNITANTVGTTAITSANLVEAGTSVLVTEFLQGLTNCFAVPFASRVSGVSGTVTSVVGTASAVIAPACRTMFHNSDPATYLNNGFVVERTSSNTGAFAGLFRSGATGVVFSQGNYEFARANGDLVISYKARDAAGNENFDALAVRKEADGKLRAIGNLYTEPGGVSAYHQLRNFATLNQSANDYYSSGYTVNVDNNGKYHHVEVTTPNGSTVTLWPTAGTSFMVFKIGGVTTGTNFIRLGSAFVNTGLTAAPSTVDSTALFFASPQRTDDQLAAIPAQSVWTFKYFRTANTTTIADVSQVYRTRARALTIGELRVKSFAKLVPEITTYFATNAGTTTGVIGLSANVPVSIDTGTGGDAWTVPAGALPPTQVRLFGRYNGVGWDDAVNFGSSQRKTTVFCQSNGVTDAHCSTTVPTGYASGATMNGLHLFARDSDGREYANFYALYKLTPRP
ncbi:MAG: hypothetical protein H7332_04150 [Bdellovibrionales bacterium]|nr:hypothetical protein [Ramlibacter sp.]